MFTSTSGISMRKIIIDMPKFPGPQRETSVKHDGLFQGRERIKIQWCYWTLMFKSQSYLSSWKKEGTQIQIMGLGTVHSGQEKLNGPVGRWVLWDKAKHWFIDFTTEFILGIYVLGVHTFLQIGKLKIK